MKRPQRMDERMVNEKDIQTLVRAAGTWSLPDELISEAVARNGWFTTDNIKMAVSHWRSILTEEGLSELAAQYNGPGLEGVTAGIVMAGNIPLVGMHDLVCTYLAGSNIRYKPSSDDEVLMDHVVSTIKKADPEAEERIVKADRLNNVDLVIATGSNNTARYFDYYFRNVPRLIRKNMTSVAVLTGSESDQELDRLAQDVFSYFGKGCRNVSAVYLPDEETVQRLMKALDQNGGRVADHHKYGNNYTYHRAIWLMNKDPFYDTGSICVKEAEDIHAPLGTLYISRYNTLDEVQERITGKKDEIQSVVGNVDGICDTAFGESQYPPLLWFADNINTMRFLGGYQRESSRVQ